MITLLLHRTDTPGWYLSQRRIRLGGGRDHELEENDHECAIIDNAATLDAKLAEACRQLDERQFADVEWFTRQRLFAAQTSTGWPSACCEM
jgi:hypothetical protein